MFNILKKNQISCFFCGKLHKEKETYILDYQSKDGKHSQNVCPTCADSLNQIADMAESMRNE